MEPSQTQETSVPTKFANFSLSSSLVRNTGLSLLPPLAILLVLYLSSFYSFLLFHSLVELGTILLSFAIFVFTWNTRQYLDNNYLLFIGISFLALLSGALWLVKRRDQARNIPEHTPAPVQ